MPLKENFNFSKSSILMYKNCPLSFYFKYATPYGKLFRQAEQPEHLTRGTLIHEFIEEYNKGNDIKEVEKMLCKDLIYAENIYGFYKILNKYHLTRALESEARYDLPESNLMGFLDSVYEFSNETIQIIKDELGDKFKGKINGNLAIIDYKTGKYHEYLHRKYQFEMNMYVYLYESVTGKKISWIGMFYTNEPENSFIEPVNRRLLANDIKDFEKQKGFIRSNVFPRKFSKLCDYCDFLNICEDYADEYVDAVSTRDRL